MQGGNKVIRVAIDPHPETMTTDHELHPDLVALWDGLRACEEAMANGESLSAGFMDRVKNARKSFHEAASETVKAIKKKTARGGEGVPTPQIVQANHEEIMICLRAIAEALVYIVDEYNTTYKRKTSTPLEPTHKSITSSEAPQYYVLTP